MRTLFHRVALKSNGRTVGVKRTYKRAKRFAEKRVAAVPVALKIERIDLVENTVEDVQHIEPRKID